MIRATGVRPKMGLATQPTNAPAREGSMLARAPRALGSAAHVSLLPRIEFNLSMLERGSKQRLKSPQSKQV